MQIDDDSDDDLTDEELFQQQMQGVVPLKQDNRVNAAKPPPVRRRDTSGDTKPEERFVDYAPDEVRHDDVPEVLSFSRPGIQHSKLAKLRQGKLHIDESIDLHGCTVSQAREYLASFLMECQDRGWTVVRIVHGKGHRSKHRVPVIKAMLNRWLRDAPEVLAFHSAPQSDGGSGALYVLLKR